MREKNNDMNVFVINMVQKMLVMLMRGESSRKLFIDCGRQWGHTTAAYEVCIRYAFLFPDLKVIGMNKEAVHPFKYQGFDTLTVGAGHLNPLRGCRSSLVIVDNYKQIMERIPNIEYEIDLTNPILTLYFQ
jgi:hypothetical protein